jgi:hypothetical protein
MKKLNGTGWVGGLVALLVLALAASCGGATASSSASASGSSSASSSGSPMFSTATVHPACPPGAIGEASECPPGSNASAYCCSPGLVPQGACGTAQGFLTHECPAECDAGICAGAGAYPLTCCDFALPEAQNPCGGI